MRAATKRQIEAEADKNEQGQFIDENYNVLTDWQYGHRPGVETVYTDRRFIGSVVLFVTLKRSQFQ
ncbi:hypothetical protein P4S72_25190 [Vibrio sp. PP-XX7]